MTPKKTMESRFNGRRATDIASATIKNVPSKNIAQRALSKKRLVRKSSPQVNKVDANRSSFVNLKHL